MVGRNESKKSPLESTQNIFKIGFEGEEMLQFRLKNSETNGDLFDNEPNLPLPQFSTGTGESRSVRRDDNNHKLREQSQKLDSALTFALLFCRERSKLYGVN